MNPKDAERDLINAAIKYLDHARGYLNAAKQVIPQAPSDRDLLWDAGERIAVYKGRLRSVKKAAHTMQDRLVERTIQRDKARDEIEELLEKLAAVRSECADLRLEARAAEEEMKLLRQERNSAQAEVAALSNALAAAERANASSQSRKGATAAEDPEIPVIGAHDPTPEDFTGFYIEDTGLRGVCGFRVLFTFHGDTYAGTEAGARELALEYLQMVREGRTGSE